MKYCSECGENLIENIAGFLVCPQEHNIYGGCASTRPLRLTLCQLPKGHVGSCEARVYWEKEVRS